MKNILIGWKRRFGNLSLTVKMFLLFSCAFLTAMGVIFSISYWQLYSSAKTNQEYLAQQRYDQAQALLEERLERIENITKLTIGNESVNHYLRELVKSKGFPTQYTQVQAVWEWIKNTYFGIEYDVILFYLDGEYPFAEGISGYIREQGSIEGQQIQELMEENGYRPVWLTKEMEKSGQIGKYLVFVRSVTNLNDYSQRLGSLHVYVRADKLMGNFLDTPWEEVYYIKSGQGELLAVNDQELYDQIQPSQELEAACLKEGGKVVAGGREYYAMKSSIGESGLVFYAVMPMDKIQGILGNTRIWTVEFFIGISMIMLAAIWLISRSVAARIQRLSKAVCKVQEGKLETLDEDAGQDEVGQLIGNYNYMIQRIRMLLEEQYRLGQAKKEAELMALQSQINPHFLYNTLDMINWMASKKETENIKDTVLSLARYYKLTLNKGKDIITIGQEVELCETYIAIQQKLFRGKILLELDVDDQIRDYLIPKITLQPLIENAIVHGIMEKSSGRGTILISGWDEGDEIFLSVTDDGVGMVYSAEQKNKGSKYGINNIELRLTLFYNMEKCITYESTQGVGTCVSIRIRKKKSETDTDIYV